MYYSYAASYFLILFIIIFMIDLVLALIPAFVASNKGYSFTLFYVLGIFFWGIMFFIAICLKDRYAHRAYQQVAELQRRIERLEGVRR